MVTALLISFHLLQARHTLSKMLPAKNLKLYTGVMAILIESALLLTVSGIIYAAIVAAREQVAGPSLGPYAAAVNMFAFFFFCFCVSGPLSSATVDTPRHYR
jgi:hypothetical protein